MSIAVSEIVDRPRKGDLSAYRCSNGCGSRKSVCKVSIRISCIPNDGNFLCYGYIVTDLIERKD